MNKHFIHIATIVLLSLGFNLNAQDITPPDVPFIDSVTVQWVAPTNPNGDVLITWQFSDSTDVRSYYIKYLNEVLGTYKFLDSVDANTNSYLDSKVITDPHYPQTYVVQAVDSSNNTSNHSDPHRTVRVFPWQKDENCQVKVELTWNAYEGWTEGIEYYDLYTVIDNNHNYIGRFAPDVFSHVYEIGETNSHYEYYMRIKSNNGRTTTSNKIPFTPDIPVKPNFINAEFATVENSQIHLRYQLDSLADINNYHLERSVDSMANFQTIMQFNNYTKTYLDITDANVKVDNHKYYYRLNLYNDCFDLMDSSRILSSVLLQGEANTADRSQFLWWNSYFNGLTTGKNHKLYRYSENEWPRIITTSTSLFEYTDDLKEQDFNSFVGDFCYYIVVDADYTGFETIQSNTICLSQEPSLEMPTAFAPNGFQKNRIFKPSFAFISSQNYYFSVFDRWGNKIFETRDYKEGWTGKKNGFTYPNGIYSFYLEYFSSQSKKFTEAGIFNLIN